MSSKIKRHKFDWRANFEKSKKFQEEVKLKKKDRHNLKIIKRNNITFFH